MSHKQITLESERRAISRRQPRTSRLLGPGLGILGLAVIAVLLVLSLSTEGPAATVRLVDSGADAARWAAMGEFYRSDALAVARGAEVSSARWAAMGEFYRSDALAVARGAEASSARWQAMADWYAPRE